MARWTFVRLSAVFFFWIVALHQSPWSSLYNTLAILIHGEWSFALLAFQCATSSVGFMVVAFIFAELKSFMSRATLGSLRFYPRSKSLFFSKLTLLKSGSGTQPTRLLRVHMINAAVRYGLLKCDSGINVYKPKEFEFWTAVSSKSDRVKFPYPSFTEVFNWDSRFSSSI